MRPAGTSLRAIQASRLRVAARGQRRRRFALTVVAALALTMLVASLADSNPDADDGTGGASGAPATATARGLSISLGPTVGRPIPASFLGFSIEYPSAANYFGTPTAPNTVFQQLVKNLDPGQRPVLRFGGDSTDWSWWPVPGVKKPPGVTISLGPRWTSIVRAGLAALNASAILGIQFEDDSRKVAGYEAGQLLSGLGRGAVAGFELGNEPEVYGALGWYHTAAGVQVPGRPRSYDVGTYLPDFRSIASALPSGVPTAGPSTGAPLYQAAVPRFIKAEPRVKFITLHRYPLRRCNTPASSPKSPTIAHLLARSSSDGLASSLAATAAVAHADGARLRIDELNSISCGGDLGVSNTFATTLWSLDTLFAMARSGVDGVNVHTFTGSWYEPFAFTDKGGAWQAQVMPLYYGLLAFADAAPPGARLLKVGQPPISTLRIWATRATDGSERIVLINESPTTARTLSLPAGRATAATLTSLTAPSLSATNGVQIGGEAFAPETTTGLLGGLPAAPSVTAANGRFAVPVPAASAVIVTIPSSGL
jgi:hypothetical protein